MNETLEAMKTASQNFILTIESDEKSSCYPYIKGDMDKQPLIIPGFEQLSIQQLGLKLMLLTPFELRKLRSYELVNQRRRSVVSLITNALIYSVFEKTSR